MPTVRETTQILARLADGDASAAAVFVPVLYDELRRLAAKFLRRERPDHTLQPTALVNEAYVRLVDQSKADWKGRAHFRAIAANELRRILVDHARARAARKRPGGWSRIELHDDARLTDRPDEELLDVETALQEFERRDPERAVVVRYLFFGGMTIEETACVLGVSKSTVKADWRFARAWLRRRLGARDE